MAAKYNPKTLAKTLTYIGYHSPGEHGLFWDPDGTMPWKELYWALQEDPGLRFVREAHIRELTLLGIELPFSLVEHLLCLRAGFSAPTYSMVTTPPERLYHACRPRTLQSVRTHGLLPRSRVQIPFSSRRDFAEQFGRRRDTECVVLEVLAQRAAIAGHNVFQAGGELFLMDSVPAEYLVFPLMREEKVAQPAPRRHVRPKEGVPGMPSAPGSFFMDARMVGERQPEKPTEGRTKEKKRREGANWKRTSRNERHKRNA